MRTYIDSSVLLRIVLGAEGAIPDWRSLEHRVSSALVEVECMRTLDRLRLVQRVADDEIAAHRHAVYALLAGMDIVEISSAITHRASQPLPVSLRSLDAIHLATAMTWRDAEQDEVRIATHDSALALAAQATGFDVIGI